MSRGKKTRVVRGHEVAAQCGMTCCVRIAIIVMSLPLSCQAVEMARGKGGRGDSDGRVSERKGSGSTMWHVMSCAHHHHRHVIPICVIAIESTRGREGGKRGAVMDMSARWCDMLCTHHHCCHVIAIELSSCVLSLCCCRREGRGKKGGGDSDGQISEIMA